MQDWTLARLQKEFLDLKKQYERETIQTNIKYEKEKNEIKAKLEKYQDEISKLNEAVVPIGFIYTQLPNQAEPTSIWPKLKWQFVTSQYANMFFRVIGDKTAQFGQNQDEAVPKLSKVNITEAKGWAINVNLQSIITPGEWSKLLYTGDNFPDGRANYYQHINFYVSNDEVRPKNTAIKIWKRIQ